jgi:hypothetical protein
VTDSLKYLLYPDPGSPRPQGAPPPSDLDDTGAFGRALSIALAMKGGVSLAVWIGGAVSEIDVLRRVRIGRDSNGAIVAEFIADLDLPPEELPFVLRRADRYATLMIARGYDRVVLDVLAGASAGGLNAVLYGVAQRAGVGGDGLLKVWTESGSAWRLLREPGYRSVPSVLSGMFFWSRVVYAIKTFYGSTANPLHRATELSVDLSATITDREYRSIPATKEGRGHFHFVGTDGADLGLARREGRDIPQEFDDVSAQRIAYAARTTSSFPGAFEQAEIWSPTIERPGRWPSAPRPAGEPDAGKAVDMSFAFSAHRREKRGVPMPIRVMDGGILDNIPIDRLYRAVRDNKPEYYGERIAVYLDPSPDALTMPRLRPQRADPPRLGLRRQGRAGTQSFIDTVTNALSSRGIRESENDEVAQLEDALLADRMADKRSVAFSNVVRHRRLGDAERTQAQSDYVAYRAATDSHLLQQTLGDPDLWQLSTDLETRSRWDSTDPVQLRALDAAFSTRYAAAGPEVLTAVHEGSQALRDAALCLLDWMSSLENEIFTTQNAGGITASDRDGLRDHIHVIGLVARRTRDQNLKRLLDELRNSGSDEPPELPPDPPVVHWITAENDSRAALVPYWQLLEGCLNLLRRYSRRVASFAGSATPWASFPKAWNVTDLAAFAAPEGIPDPVSLLQYSHLTAAQATALESAFAPLLEQQDADAVAAWLRLPTERFKAEAKPENLSTTLAPASKLAGSTLANFGAFFSRAWRTNDWWWGRLDAAAGLVSTLQLLPSAPAALDVPTTIEVYPEDVQRMVLLQANATDPQTRPFPEAVAVSDPPPLPGSPAENLLADRIAGSMEAGAHTLARLKPSYLTSVSSRAVHLALRALRSGLGWVPKIAISLFLPPLLSLAPFAFSRTRVPFAVITLFALLRLVEETGGHGGRATANWGDAIPLVIAVLFWVAGAAQTIGRWVRIGGMQLLSSSGAYLALRARVAGAVWRSAALLALGTAALALAIVHLAAGARSDVPMIALCVASAVLPAVAAASSSKLNRGARPGSAAAWFALAAIMAVVVLGPVSWFGALVRVPDAVLIGIAASVIFATVSYGWLGSFTDGPERAVGLIWWMLISAACGLGGAGASAFVISALGTQHALTGTPLGFAAGLATGLVAWFASSHVGWWLSELVRTNDWPDVDAPKFGKPAA